MKKVLYFALLLSFSMLKAQDIIPPATLDKTILSGVGLQRVKPGWAPPERQLHTTPVFSGDDLGIYVTTSNTAFMDWKNYAIDEFVYVLNGKAEVTPLEGEKQTFQKGDFFLVPKGFTGRWKTIETSGDFMEIAIYTKPRAPEISESIAKVPYAFSKSIQSPTELNSSKTIFKGDELLVSVLTQEKGASQKVKLDTDEFGFILNGMLKVIDRTGKETHYFSGESYVLPKNFEGTLEFDGLDTFKAITVTSSLEPA